MRSDRPATVRAPGPQLSGTNLVHAGDHNQRVTLHAVRVNGPVTRAELALKTGLTAAAIANITNRLLKDRLILNAGRLRGARGQPATKFVVNPDSCFSIGLNVDRDHITLIVLDFVGKVRARASREIHFANPAQGRSLSKAKQRSPPCARAAKERLNAEGRAHAPAWVSHAPGGQPLRQ